ncbi:MAG: penicillin-binding transpeptidase domain-containing protein, partial [Oscillospiraceae bacterium]|nr:penicillin-binding transpeptidase domain-containing protein [Oscillospiraceae bacterium]
VVVLGMAYYICRYLFFGSYWAGQPFNQTVYKGAISAVGKVVDTNGVMLADSDGGTRTFAESRDVRRATLHVVGDRDGNVGTGALSVYASDLAGYNPITGSTMSSVTGETLTLTIDSRLSVEALAQLGNRRGTVIVSNYITGEILCMVSSPTFDPALQTLPEVDDERGEYWNRALQSAYTPGSVFKIVTAAAAIEMIPDIYDRVFNCEGQFNAGNGQVVCANRTGHGRIDFKRGLADSCNVVFGMLALELGADVLASYAEQYDLSAAISVGGVRTASGRFERANPNTIDLAWSGIGQHKNEVCPAAMLRFVGAIANGGIAAELHYLVRTGISSILPNSSARLMPSDTASQLGEIMIIDDESIPGLRIHAKTGTAERDGEEGHSWYVGYIENSEYPYAFVVVAENSGRGSGVAASIARQVLRFAVLQI